MKKTYKELYEMIQTMASDNWLQIVHRNKERGSIYFALDKEDMLRQFEAISNIIDYQYPYDIIEDCGDIFIEIR